MEIKGSKGSKGSVKSGQPVSIVFAPVGVRLREGVFHLSSECELITGDGVRPMRWSEARAACLLPRFCELCGPLSGLL